MARCARTIVLAWLVAAAGCAASDATVTTEGATATETEGGPVFEFAGQVEGDDVPAEATVAVVWLVRTAGLASMFKYGDGRASGGEFMVSIAGEAPPDVALSPLNKEGVGQRIAFGMLMMWPAEREIPEGVVGFEAIGGLIGLAERYAVIWRDGEDWGDAVHDWPLAFPAGEFACGRCQEGQGIDWYEPVDCTEVTITAGAPESFVGCDFL